MLDLCDTADPHSYVPPETLELARWEDPSRKQLIEEQRQRHLKENSKPPTLYDSRKKRPKKTLEEDTQEQESTKPLTPRVLVAGLEDTSAPLRDPQFRRRKGAVPWKGLKPSAHAKAGDKGIVEMDSDDDDWDLVRQRFGGDRQGTLEIREADGNILVVKPFPEPPANRLPAAAVKRTRKRAVGTTLAPSEPITEEKEDSEALEPSHLGIGHTAPVTDFFAEDEGPRPTTNAPDIAEQRAQDVNTLCHRPQQEQPHRHGSRRAHVRLPTFEAGGQEYRMLPRRREKRS